MTENNLSEQLTQQNGPHDRDAIEKEQKRIHTLIEKDEARRKQMSIIMRGLWIFALFCWVLSILFSEFEHKSQFPIFSVMGAILFQLAMISTVLYYIRLAISRYHRLNERIQFIENLLMHLIEKQKE